MIHEPAPVFWVKRNSPAPIRCLFRREADVIQPATVEEFGRAVGSGRPSQRRNRVDDGSQSIFRVFDFDESLFEGSVRSFKLNRNERNVAGSVDQLKIAAQWCPRFRIVHCERAQHLAILRNEWFGPGCGKPMALESTRERHLVIADLWKYWERSPFVW